MNILKTFYSTILPSILYFGIVYLDCIDANITEALGCQLRTIGENSPIQDDLLSFLSTNNLYGQSFSTDGATNRFRYDFTLCGDVTKKKAPASILRTNKLEGTSDAIGLRNSTTLRGKQGEWIMIEFGPGDNDSQSTVCKNVSLSSSVMIVCDRDFHTGQFKLIYEDLQICQFLFELRIAAVCGEAPGMSGWSILFLILFIGLVLYFILGMLYLRYHQGAKGVEQIPNKEFWFRLGNIIADFFSCICRCDQFCSPSLDQLDSDNSRYSGGYSPIGEGAPAMPSSRSYDKDTALLNP